MSVHIYLILSSDSCIFLVKSYDTFVFYSMSVESTDGFLRGLNFWILKGSLRAFQLLGTKTLHLVGRKKVNALILKHSANFFFFAFHSG